MKYIRTENGVLGCFTPKHEHLLEDKEYIKENKIIKIANTIEELCDCLVLWKNIIPIRHSKAKCDVDEFAIKRGNYAWDERKYKEAYSNTYGAIWTDKGLIYVAKANEKGELELL